LEESNFMRLSIALGALAGGLVLGSAALALADAPPPAAPIFYCPAAPGKGGPASSTPAAKSCPPAANSAPAAPSTPVARVEHRRDERRHEPRYAGGRWTAHEGPPREDVSASQAFIYRYERAVHGFNAEAADQAWAHGGPPPSVRDDRRMIRQYAAAPPPAPIVAPPPPPAPPERIYVQPAPPPPVVVEVGPTPPARVYVERVAPPPPPPQAYAPPCPDRCPPAYEHDGWRDQQARAEAPALTERRAYAETAPPREYSGHYGYLTPPPGAYQHHEEHYGYTSQDHAYAYERRETEQSSSWRSSDGHYVERSDDRRGPCPPSPDHGCSAAGDGYGAAHQYSGRDAYGFLVWPGKSDGQ
jgi:hypothetical protein